MSLTRNGARSTRTDRLESFTLSILSDASTELPNDRSLAFSIALPGGATNRVLRSTTST